VRIRSFNEALRIARSAGEDAANRRARKAGRKTWSEADLAYAASETERILASLGFDVAGWAAMAGLARNEPPDEPAPRAKGKRRSRRAPVQLSFSFA
jgi:hypothetical protein